MKQKEEQVLTNIESDVVFKGTFKFKETLQVKGSLQGRIFGETGQILLEKGGCIEGEVKAARIENHGVLNGSGEVGDYCLYGDGVSSGHWKMKSLMVEKGALFNGQSQMEK